MQTRIHTQSLHFHLCKEFEVDGQMQTDSVQHILVGNTPIQPTYSIECTKLVGYLTKVQRMKWSNQHLISQQKIRKIPRFFYACNAAFFVSWTGNYEIVNSWIHDFTTCACSFGLVNWYLRVHDLKTLFFYVILSSSRLVNSWNSIHFKFTIS